MEGDAPEQSHRGEEPERRDGDRDHGDELAREARPAADGRDTGVGLIASSICVSYHAAANRYSRSCECSSTSHRCGSRSSEQESRAWALPTCCRAPTRSSSSSATRARRAREHDRRTTGSRSTPASSSTTSGTTRSSSGSSRELGVRTQDSEMSFSVGCGRCGLEWSGRRPFAQPLNAASPRFLALLAEVGALAATARRALEDASYEDRTLGSTSSPSAATRGASATTSSSRSRRRSGRRRRSARSSFPAAYAIRFFDNHGMLGFGRFDWRTVAGGSRAYVGRALRAAARPAARSAWASASCGARSTASSLRTRGRAGAALRQGRRRHARRPGAAAARRPERRRSGASSAPSATRRTTPCCTPTPRFLPRTARRPRVLELPRARLRRSTGARRSPTT